MAKYTLLLRETGDQFAHLSPAEMQAIIARYSAWSTALRDSHNLAGSQKLRDGSGKLMHRSNDRIIVSDGPYAEGKEVIAGLFVLEAPSYDEAVAIAKGCPHLDFGTIEIREVEIFR
jgi:hypothetical protein